MSAGFYDVTFYITIILLGFLFVDRSSILCVILLSVDTVCILLLKSVISCEIKTCLGLAVDLDDAICSRKMSRIPSICGCLMAENQWQRITSGSSKSHGKLPTKVQPHALVVLTIK